MLLRIRFQEIFDNTSRFLLGDVNQRNNIVNGIKFIAM